jgi:hypothetical protein
MIDRPAREGVSDSKGFIVKSRRASTNIRTMAGSGAFVRGASADTRRLTCRSMLQRPGGNEGPLNPGGAVA